MKKFSSLNPESKLWIYQSSRELTDDEVADLSNGLQQFCQQWTAHNNQLKADFDIRFNRFVILVVDESHNTASGCSIDKSVHFLADAGKRYSVDFFNKLQMHYWHKETIQTIPLASIKEAFANGSINDQTVFINTYLTTLQDYKAEFELPLNRHWLGKRVLG